ncbi:MAG: hypothetical protein WC700_10270 [Gemmatimonadaceae bacterium]|jgi:hypothetical protein
MTAINRLRTDLATAESVHVALCHRYAEAKLVAARAELDEQEARILVSEARHALDDAEGRERDREKARLWDAYLESCRVLAVAEDEARKQVSP